MNPCLFAVVLFCSQKIRIHSCQFVSSLSVLRTPCLTQSSALNSRDTKSRTACFGFFPS